MKFCPQCGQSLMGSNLEDKQGAIPKPEAPLMESSTAKTGQHGLGPILHTHGNMHICQGGISDGDMTILWEDVGSLFWGAYAHTLILVIIPIPTHESQNIRVVNSEGDEILLRQTSPGRIAREKREGFWSLYMFIVSKLMDRQWLELTKTLEKGERASFRSFDITSTAIYRKRFRGYDKIDLHRVVGCGLGGGQFSIYFVDEKGRQKNVGCGPVSEIPNVHLAQAFLSSIARKNSGIR
jgi:hypothetical protein